MFNENAVGSQVTQVGMDFKPGIQGNVQIERLLGFESDSFGGIAHRRIADETHALQWVASPDYCGDDALCIEMLEERFNVTVVILPTISYKGKKKPKPFVEEYVAVFEVDNALYTTVSLATEEHASACALWFLLSTISHE
jgi:hypothetical protein